MICDNLCKKKVNDLICKKINIVRELVIGNFDDFVVNKSCIENFVYKVFDYYWFYV